MKELDCKEQTSILGAGEKMFYSKEVFKLENGKKLESIRIAYHTYGTLNAQKDNVVWVCHALTANSDVFDWWKGLFGENCLFNPDKHFIICANVLTSQYGSTFPLDINPNTGSAYYQTFPVCTVRDMVNAHKLLANHLGIQNISVLIGGSLGGQQALEWAISEPLQIKKLITIASNAQHSSWGIAFNESQRLAITTDRTFFANTPNGGKKGLKVARTIALLSYRSYETYAATQGEVTCDKMDNFKASSYQNYQGEKLINRFNAYSYWYLTKAMDSHNVGRDRGSVEEALSEVKAKTLVIGIPSDVLFQINEQRFIAKHIPNAQFAVLDSFYGHDGFLIETEILTNQISEFLDYTSVKNSALPVQSPNQ
jgi:homoserine O-acetyltransferase